MCEGLPAWLCGRMQTRAVLEPQAVVEDLRLARERLAANWGAATFVLMPSFAFGLWLLYRDRRLRCTEHLVFALLAIPVYAVLAMRRVYGGSRAGLALRAVVLSMAYAALVGLAIVTLGLVALLA